MNGDNVVYELRITPENSIVIAQMNKSTRNVISQLEFDSAEKVNKFIKKLNSIKKIVFSKDFVDDHCDEKELLNE